MKPKSTLRPFLALAGSSLLAISSASAADGTWDTNAAGNWTDIANWLGDAAYASGTDSTATFGDFITADRIVTLNAPITIGNITASDITHNYTISGSGLNILTLDRSSGIPTINVTSGRTLTFGSEIAGLDGLQKSGLGTLSLTGANSYTGTTTITSGILQLNFSIAGAPTSNIISNSSVLSLGGGQLTVTGKASTTTSQSFASTSVTGSANTIANIANATANPQLVALGAITRSAGATLNFSLPTGGQTASNGITTSNTTTNGTIGGWATVGNNGWAGKTGDNITSGSVIYTTTTTAGTTAANYTDNNIDVTNGAGLIDNVITPNSLRYNTLGAFTMTLAAGDNIIGSGGILVTGTVGNNTSTITGGDLAGSSGGELIIHQHNTTGTSSTLTIGSIIKNNGGATGLTKSGSGTLGLSGNNSYTGITTINTGTVLISHANALGTTAGNTTIAATGSTSTGGQLQLAGAITSAENITITGSTEISGFAAAISGTANNTNTLSGNITLSNLTGGVRIASGNAGARLNFTGTISQTGSSQALVFALGNAGGQTVTVNNPIALNGGSLILTGNGSPLILKGVNATDGSGIGTTTINNGGVVLQLGVTDAINTTATLTVNGNLNLANFNQTVNALNGASTGVVSNGTAGTRTLTVGNGGGSGTFSGTIVTGTGNIQLIKTGGGTQTLNGVNTYTGTTAVNGGTLALGTLASINASANISIAAGTTFDVSQQTSPYTLSASTTLSASGTGTTAGSTAARIVGPSAGVVSLGAQTVTLTWAGDTSGTDTDSPPLHVSQGALTLNNNAITINGSTLGLGTYRLIQVGDGATGTLNENVTPSYAVSGTAIDGTKTNVISSDGSGNIILTVTAGGGITFANWKTANGAGLQTLADDHDGDGVDNGTEFFLFGNAVSTGFNALPSVTNTLGTLSVTWTKAASYPGTYGTDFRVETSDTLSGTWTQENVPPTPGATVVISGNNVTYTFPNPLGTKKFARLKVTGP